MNEKEEAFRLAHAVLDKPHIDPDGDISMLARQFLRAREEIDAMRAALTDTLASLEYWYSAGNPDFPLSKFPPPHKTARSGTPAPSSPISPFRGSHDQ